nr:glycosyltransferase [Synechococcus elongatus PCC 11802]
MHYHKDGSRFDREFAAPFTWQEACRIRTKNASFLLGYEDIDWGVTPTRFQWDTLPVRVQERTSIIHDGIDIEHVKPNPQSKLLIQSRNLTISRENEVITFISRNLEPTRGFHRFMRALPQIQANHPNAHIFIVGREGNGYGAAHPSGKSYKQVMLEELEGQLNLDQLHFLGPLPYGQLLKLLQLSSIHIYFTIPFVLSWSLMEAMACGALIIGSKTPPLEEVIQHGKNGLLVDYFQTSELVEAVKEVFQHRDRYESLRQAARQTIVEHYDLRYSLRRQQALILALGAQVL